MIVIPYPGKKNYLAKWIVEHFPQGYQNMTYLEPFFGSGSVFFCKERSMIETINDLDSEIFNLFLQIRDNPEELILSIMNTAWGRDEFDLSFEKSDNPIEQARRCIVRFWFNVGASAKYKNGMRFEIKSNTGGFKYFHIKLPDVIAEVSDRLKHDNKTLVQIENRNVFELLPKYNRENVLIYLDPPYVLETRNYKKFYKFEFTDDDHVELLKQISVTNAKVIISGYENNLYEKFLGNWRKVKKGSKDQAGNIRTECLWLNYSVENFQLFNEEQL